ncbi:MAG TPA: MFS transporter [Candidatus Saccharimonadia bacterium]|nr:MFS transporter [Candidatus Saccharimonadia bacterium]
MFRNEMWRSAPAGILDTAYSTFGMIVAVQVFAASDAAKAVFLSSPRAGLIAALFVVPLLLRWRSTVAQTAALTQYAGALCFTLAALFPHSEEMFITGISMGFILFSLQIPLMTQLYRANYPREKRGRLYAITSITRALGAAIFSWGGGWLLGWRLEMYPWLLWFFALMAFISGWLTYGLPATPWEVPEAEDQRLWRSWRWVREDRDFRTLLISWMIMGLGNLIAFSLWVEFLANPAHGIGLSADKVALLTGVIPLLARLASSYHWGILFDRAPFFVVRITLNLITAASILVFYLGDNMWWWGTGMALTGLSLAGGNVAWALFVTKLAPEHAVAEYMSVHTFLTGIRGVIAPFLAYAMIEWWSFSTMAWVCAGLVVAASGFIAVRRKGERIGGRVARPELSEDEVL